MGYIEHAYIYIQCTCSVVVFSFAIPLSSLSTVFYYATTIACVSHKLPKQETKRRELNSDM